MATASFSGEGRVPMEVRYTAVIQQHGEWWIG
jgi:hypothetical protein